MPVTNGYTVEKKTETTATNNQATVISDAEATLIKNRMIDVKKYKSLPKKQQELYVAINPPTEWADLAKQLTQFLTTMFILEPIYEVYTSLPRPTPLEMVVELLKPINTMLELLKSIRSLRDVPVIGTLVAPLCDLLDALFMLLGNIVALVVFFYRFGALIFDLMDAYANAQKGEQLDDAFESLKKDFDFTSLDTYLTPEDRARFEQMYKELIKKPLDEIEALWKDFKQLLMDIKEAFKRLDPFAEFDRPFKLLGCKQGPMEACGLARDPVTGQVNWNPKMSSDLAQKLKQQFKQPMEMMDQVQQMIEEMQSKKYCLKDPDYIKLKKYNEQKKAEREKAEKEAYFKKNGVQIPQIFPTK